MSVRALAILRQHIGAVCDLLEGAFDRPQRRRISSEVLRLLDSAGSIRRHLL